MIHTILLLAALAPARTPAVTPTCQWPRQCVEVAITGPCPAGRVCVQTPLS
ncbi:MAG: hypothetical protein KGI84_05075 [Elusimicrobia bacterium]|nr:hypothetical protein [Elusimicrobiota bacterium]